ncbi:MAG: metG 2 [Myxococcales bacterium]|nr:metG 2 [Myxococcales bacterium]
MKPTVQFDVFEQLDIRVGKIVGVDIASTKKPTYRLEIDFGTEIGRKVSCGGYRHYPVEALMGKLVLAVVNFPTKKMGPEKSEVLVLGVNDDAGNTVYVSPASDVPVGQVLF